MKKLKVLSIMMMVAILVSGCSMKTDFNLKVKANKQVSIGAIMAMDDDLIDTMLDMQNTTGETKKHTDSERWEYLKGSMEDSENENVKYEKYTEGKYKGYTLTTPSADIDLLTKSSASERFNLGTYFDGNDDTNGDPILFVKDGEYYVSNITFDASDSESLSQMNTNSENFDFFEFKFVVTLPVKPVSNNADTVSSDGKTLSWDLTKGAKDIEFKFNFKGAKDPEENNNKNNGSNNNGSKEETKDEKKDNTLYYVIGAAAAGALVAGVIVAVSKKKNA